VREDHRRCRVDADREVVGDEPLDVVGKPDGRVAIGDRLVVGNQDIELDTEALEADPVLERAEVVADVQRARRPVTGQDPERRGLLRMRSSRSPSGLCLPPNDGGEVGVVVVSSMGEHLLVGRAVAVERCDPLRRIGPLEGGPSRMQKLRPPYRGHDQSLFRRGVNLSPTVAHALG
jgi:hypothetical protein